MRRLLALVLSLGAVTAPAAAQTTGVPFINDYTVAGVASGSTSCTPVPIPGGGVVPFTVTASAPGLPVFLFATISTTPGVACLCKPCTIPASPSPCAIPFTTCGFGGALSNQSVDLPLTVPFCLLLTIPGVTVPSGTGGVFTTSPLLPPGLVFSTQAIVVDPGCASASFGVVITQAYDVFT
jgi:hypothetical protein